MNTVSILTTQPSSAAKNIRETGKHPHRQIGILCGFLLAFFALYLLMAFIAMPPGAPYKVFAAFMAVWGYVSAYILLPLTGCC